MTAEWREYRFQVRRKLRHLSAVSQPLHWRGSCAIRRVSQRRKVLTMLDMRV
jgi:hypothetical protein